MLMTEESARVRKIVTDSLAELLANCLTYKTQFTVEALFAITLDSTQEFHFTVSENVKIDSQHPAESDKGPDVAGCMSEQQKQEEDKLAFITPTPESINVDDDVYIVQENRKKLKGDIDKTRMEIASKNREESDASPDVVICTNGHQNQQSEQQKHKPALIVPTSEAISVDDEVYIVKEDLKKSKVACTTRTVAEDIKDKQASPDKVQTPNVINIVPEPWVWTNAGDQPINNNDSYGLPLKMTAENVPTDDEDEKLACTEEKLACTEDKPASTEDNPGCVEVANGRRSSVESARASGNTPQLIDVDSHRSESTDNQPIAAVNKKSIHKAIQGLFKSNDPKLLQALNRENPKIYLGNVDATRKRPGDHGVENVVKKLAVSSNHGSARACDPCTHKPNPQVLKQSCSYTSVHKKSCKLVQVIDSDGRKICKIAETSIPHGSDSDNTKVIQTGVSLLQQNSQAQASLVQPSQVVHIDETESSNQTILQKVHKLGEALHVRRQNSIPTTNKGVARKILLSKGPMVTIPRIQNLFQGSLRPCTAQVKGVMAKLVEEQFGRMHHDRVCTPTGNGTALVFYKRNPTEFKFPITKYDVSEQDYVENFYDTYSQGWDPDKHKGELKCSSWT